MSEQHYLIRATQQRTNQVRFFDRHELLVIKALAQPFDETTARRIVNQAIVANKYPTHDLEVIPDYAWGFQPVVAEAEPCSCNKSHKAMVYTPLTNSHNLYCGNCGHDAYGATIDELLANWSEVNNG